MNAQQEISEFIRGQRDCKQGNPHKPNQGQDDDRGYRAQYEIEQINTERTSRHDARITAKA